MSEVRVSCIVTSYRREISVVKRAIDSILIQTYTDYEILVVDDNRGEGADFYSQSIRKLEGLDTRITVLKTEGGHGGQYARNTGIIHSCGEFVAFLDDDDEWVPEKLEKQLKIMETHPEVGLCYTDGYAVNEVKNPDKKVLIHGQYFNPRLTFRELLHEDRIGSTSQAMIRRSVFNTVGMFDTDMPARQDYEMWLRISRIFPIYGIDEGLYIYHLASDEGRITRNWKNCVKAHTLLGEKYHDEIKGDRDAEFNVVFHIAHYYRIGFGIERNAYLFFKFLHLYIRSFFLSPRYFIKQAGYKFYRLKRMFSCH